MNAKVNLNIVLKLKEKVEVKLWDVDVLKDDLIDSKVVSNSGHLEFIFNTSETGEFKPELQIRIYDLNGHELHRTSINDSISDLNINKVTGFIEVSTIDFGTIEV